MLASICDEEYSNPRRPVIFLSFSVGQMCAAAVSRSQRLTATRLGRSCRLWALMTAEHQRDGLAVGLHNSVGMAPPIDMFRLARCSGFKLVAVFGPVCVARCGLQIVFDASQTFREQHAAVARALAGAVLERHRYEVRDDAIEAVARSLLLPIDEFAHDLQHVMELDELDDLHPHAPHAWIADRVEELQRSTQRHSSIVELRPRQV